MPPTSRRMSMAQKATRRAKAAKTIQKYWKQQFAHRGTKKLVIRMTEGYKVTSDYLKTISFDQLVAFTKNKRMVAALKAGLQRIHMKVTFLHGSPPESRGVACVNVRVFLAAYLIALWPTDVFSEMGVLETQLLEGARAVLARFQTICDAILLSDNDALCFGQKMEHETSKAFSAELFAYFRLFKEWKVPDEKRLCVRVHNALWELYRAQRGCPQEVSLCCYVCMLCEW